MDSMTPTTTTNTAPAISEKEAARRARVVARYQAAAAVDRAERQARNLAVADAIEGTTGDARKAARKATVLAHKAARRDETANALARTGQRMSFDMPTLDAKGKGTVERTLTVTYLDPTTGEETRALVVAKLTVSIRERITLGATAFASLVESD